MRPRQTLDLFLTGFGVHLNTYTFFFPKVTLSGRSTKVRRGVLDKPAPRSVRQCRPDSPRRTKKSLLTRIDYSTVQSPMEIPSWRELFVRRFLFGDCVFRVFDFCLSFRLPCRGRQTWETNWVKAGCRPRAEGGSGHA